MVALECSLHDRRRRAHNKTSPVPCVTQITTNYCSKFSQIQLMKVKVKHTQFKIIAFVFFSLFTQLCIKSRKQTAVDKDCWKLGTYISRATSILKLFFKEKFHFTKYPSRWVESPQIICLIDSWYKIPVWTGTIDIKWIASWRSSTYQASIYSYVLYRIQKFEWSYCQQSNHLSYHHCMIVMARKLYL